MITTRALQSKRDDFPILEKQILGIVKERKISIFQKIKFLFFS